MKKRSAALVLAVLLLALVPLVSGDHGGNQHGLDFDGNDNYATFPALLAENPSEYSVCFWVKTDDTNAEYRPFSYSEEGQYISFRINEGATANKVYVLAYDGAVQEVSTTAYTVTNWLQICGVVKENDNLTLYVNSNFIGNDTIANFQEVSAGRVIGASRDAITNFYPGIIDNMVVFNDTLSPMEVSSLYNGDESTMENDVNLVLHYKLNEGSGQTLGDSSGNGNIGTLGSTGGVDTNDPLWTSDCTWWFTWCDTEAAESFAKGELPSAVHTFTRFSLTSTSFIGTPHTANITLSAESDMLLLASLQVEASTAAVAWFRLLLDDAAYLEQERIVGTEPGNMIMVDLVENVVAGTHNVEMEARVSTGTLTIVNSSIAAVAMNDGYGAVPAAQDFVASDTTISGTLEDITGLSFSFETYATSFLWIGFTFSGEVSIAVKTGATAIVYDDTLLETHSHYWATSGDKHSLFAVTRTNVKVTPGLHTVKAQWSVTGGTLTGENISLVAFASESDEGDREFFLGKAVDDDTTESNTLEDMDGIGLTATVADSAHLLATLDYESSVNASSRSLFHGVSIMADSPPILERGLASSSELADAGTIRRTDSKLTSDTAVQAQWYVEAATLGTADDAILTVLVLRTTKIDPESGPIMLLLVGILAVFAVVAVVAMKKR